MEIKARKCCLAVILFSLGMGAAGRAEADTASQLANAQAQIDTAISFYADAAVATYSGHTAGAAIDIGAGNAALQDASNILSDLVGSTPGVQATPEYQSVAGQYDEAQHDSVVQENALSAATGGDE